MERSFVFAVTLTVGVLSLAVVAAQPSAQIAEAHYQQGLAFYQSKPPDYVNASVWYRRAAELGHAAAQNDLGWLYQNGWGVPRDAGQALYWYRQAATRGDAAAQVNLGWMYENGRGVARDHLEAMRWYRQAAAQNNPIAADNLGVLHRDGLGVPRDYVEAVVWFRRSAAAGNAWGQTNLGWMYENGWGVPRDYAEAMTWYRRAAAQGNALAQNNLGVLYRDSLGVPRDLDQALAWFRKAAAGGEPRAQQSLRHLESLDRGMDPWADVLDGKSIRVAISAKGLVYLFVNLPIRLTAGGSIDVEIPVKIFTDPELRDLGILQPNGSLAMKENPHLPYKPMRAASEAQKRRFFEDHRASAVAIHWPPYVIVVPGVDQRPAGTKEAIREAVERLYER